MDMTEELKVGITNKFDKAIFHLIDHNTGDTGSFDCVDAGIRDFIEKLNENPHIMTEFSCEGHKNGDVGYFTFRLDPEGWDIFWQKIMPALSFCFCSINPHTPKDLRAQMSWHAQVVDNEHGAGIALYGYFNTVAAHEAFGTPEFSWEIRKWRFWDVIRSVFLEYFPGPVSACASDAEQP